MSSTAGRPERAGPPGHFRRGAWALCERGEGPIDIYDDFAGDELDRTLWEPLNLGADMLEEGARTTVEGGTLTIDVPVFTNASTENQGIDNSKHVLLSTRDFVLPADRPTRFDVEIAVDHIGGDSGDYRLGVAALALIDWTNSTGLVLDVLLTADRVFAEHEVLPFPGVANPFTRVVESPLLPPRGSGFRRCGVTIDRAGGHVRWDVDDVTMHEAGGLTSLPGSMRLGLGFFTLMPIGSDGGSCRGQGARARWRRFRSDA